MQGYCKTALALIGCAVVLIPTGSQAQERQRRTSVPAGLGSSWVTPYFGVGFESDYYDGIVVFNDGSSDLLEIDPTPSLVLGVQAGYRFRPRWSLMGNIAYATSEAALLRNDSREGGDDFSQTQLEGSLLYDLGGIRIAGELAPLQVGGGLSLVFHSVGPFSWRGGVVDAGSTAIGAHGLTALNYPLTPRADLHTHAKLAFLRPSLGDLERQLARAEGVGAATLNADAITQLIIALGVRFRF